MRHPRNATSRTADRRRQTDSLFLHRRRCFCPKDLDDEALHRLQYDNTRKDIQLSTFVSTPIVENAFGILANRFQCLLTTLQVGPVAAKNIIMACVTLHNLMRIRYPGLQNQYLDVEGEDHNVIHGAWRDAGVLADLASMKG